jgi:hypothetical protein
MNPRKEKEKSMSDFAVTITYRGTVYPWHCYGDDLWLKLKPQRVTP